MERKEYIKLAATKAKSLKPGQMIRITAEGKYWVMRDVDGCLFFGQSFISGTGENEAGYKPFFEARQSLPQYREADGVLMGYWQRFMPTREEAQKHGVSPKEDKWSAKK